jgi:hypothetical protein
MPPLHFETRWIGFVTSPDSRVWSTTTPPNGRKERDVGRRSLALSMRRPQNGRGQSSNSGATSASEPRLNIHRITGKVRISRLLFVPVTWHFLGLSGMKSLRTDQNKSIVGN